MKVYDDYCKALFEFHMHLEQIIKRLNLMKEKVNNELSKEGREI